MEIAEKRSFCRSSFFTFHPVVMMMILLDLIFKHPLVKYKEDYTIRFKRESENLFFNSFNFHRKISSIKRSSLLKNSKQASPSFLFTLFYDDSEFYYLPSIANSTCQRHQRGKKNLLFFLQLNIEVV